MNLTCASCGAEARRDNPYAPIPDWCAACGAARPIDLPPPAATLAGGDRLQLGNHADLRITMTPGPPRLIEVRCQPKDINHWIAWPTTVHDNVDVRTSIRLLEGNPDKIAAGLSVRESRLGSYGFRIDGGGMFEVAYWVGLKFGGHLVPWTRTDALRTGFGVTNQLRLVARGVELRGWINGVQVFVLHDARYPAGTVHVTLEPGDRPAHVLITELDVRDA